MTERVTAYLGLGGNVGDVAASMADALKRINAHPQCEVSAVSRVYHTPPWGPVEQDWFLNACARVETELSAPVLLEFVLEIEREAGRVRETRWGPRTLDIDILLYGEEPVRLEHLTIPHPRMTERAFVMAPLADIAGDVTLDGCRVSEFAQSLPKGGMTATETKLEF